MKRLIRLLCLLAVIAALSVSTAAPKAEALGGNLSAHDNCQLAMIYRQLDGGLPGDWALYDAYFQLGDWTIDPGSAFYECQAFSFTWGFANWGIFDSDATFGGDGYWTGAQVLHFTWTTRLRFPNYTRQFCAGNYVTATFLGQQCF